MSDPERDPAPGDAPTPPPRERERRADVIPFPVADRDAVHRGRRSSSRPGDPSHRPAEQPPHDVEAPPVHRPLREVVGEVLRDERHDQGRTLADVAAGAFVSLPYLSEVERGLKDVSSDVLASICAALDVPLPDVLERSADRLRARAQCGHGVQLRAA